MAGIASILIFFVVLLLQIVAGYILGFMVPYFVLAIGDGLELIAMPIGFTLGVWGVGAAAAGLRRRYRSGPQLARLAVTAIGSVLGVGLILLTPATGFGQVLYPFVGALAGYYMAAGVQFMRADVLGE